MAEAVLYDNTNEPEFPYESVSQLIKWIPDYIERYTFKRGRNSEHAQLYEMFINIILVFARARTSTLYNYKHLRLCRSLIKRLNNILRSLGAQHHCMEIVHCTTITFFITCSRSPRFNWKHPLSHRQAGQNLDFYAAGHIVGEK